MGFLDRIETFYESFVNNVMEMKVTRASISQINGLLETLKHIPDMIDDRLEYFYDVH
jgi:hypothetical protein